MKALVCKNKELTVKSVAQPKLEKGDALLEVLRCGICGSDLHARRHCNHWGGIMQKAGYQDFMSEEQSVIMGHEFCGEILDYGPLSASRYKVGTKVCAIPLIRRNNAVNLIGFSKDAGGAYAERMAVDENLMVPIPNGLDVDSAALTEPMAVGLHAVNRAEMKARDVAIVIGCGPVGLAVIASLKAKGVKTIVASDFSAKRRELARKCGAHVLIDPAEQTPFDNWEEYGFVNTIPHLLDRLLEGFEKLRSLPMPWWHTWRIAEKLGAIKPKSPVIFECVGMPGLINQIIEGAPMYSKVVVAGVCMEADKIEPAQALNKEIDLRFSSAYTPLEFRTTLHMLANGKLNAEPMITGIVGLHGVDMAFDLLAGAEDHAKILVNPTIKSAELSLA